MVWKFRFARCSAALLLFVLSAAALRAEDDVQTLSVGTKHAPPFAILHEDGSWSGISIDLWRLVAADLGLHFEFRETDLEGLITGLESGEFDIAVAAITPTASREARIDFSHTYYHSGLKVVVSGETGGSTFEWLPGLLTPGFFKAVLALVAILLAAGTAVWFFERRRNPTEFGGSVVQGLGSSFWWSAVTMTTVGYGDKIPVTAGGRMVALVWMFTGVVVISGLTAAITSSLTVTRLQSRIDELRDLTDVSVAAVRDSTSATRLRQHGYRIEQFDTLEEGLDAVVSGEVVAMVHDAPIIRYELLSNPKRFQELQLLPEVLKVQNYAFGLPPGSALREQINRVLLRRTSEDRWDRTLQYYLGI
jgi:ABC-type amino acid transport substrate-binding protein